MSITFDYLCQELGHDYLTLMANPHQILINIWAADLPKKLNCNYLYFIKASALKKQMDNLEFQNLIVYLDVDLKEELIKLHNVNMVLEENGAEYKNLKLRIQEIFDMQARTNNYAFGLMERWRSREKTANLLAYAYNYIRNPLALFDTSMGLMEQVGLTMGHKDANINYLLENSYLSDEMVNAIVSGKVSYYEGPSPFNELIIFNKDTVPRMHIPVIFMKITMKNHLLGYLAMFEVNRRSEMEQLNAFAILSYFLGGLMSETLPRLPVSNPRIEDFLINILSKKLTEPQKIERLSSYFHMDVNTKKVVICVSYNPQKCGISLLYSVKDHLQRMFKTEYCVFFNNSIVVVPLYSWFEENKKQFQEFLKGNQMLAGVSLPIRNFIELSRYYSEAVSCLDIRESLKLEEEMIEFSTYKMMLLFTNFQGICDLEQLLPDYIYTLQNNDKRKGTELVKTLFTYVKCGEDISKAAQRLNLHYNTMKYRINQIEALTDIDFEDDNCIFQITIAAKVFDLKKIPY